jgi:lipopolysaccharide biosynthesis glycosyltransferase
MSEPVLHVASTSDSRYVLYSATMLRSLFTHAPGRRFAVHMLCPPELGQAQREALGGVAARFGHDMTFHAVGDERVAGLPHMRNLRRLSWYRIFLPELLPDVDRVLYLDGDVLVVDGIDELWATELGGHALAAVPNVIEPRTRSQLLPALGLPPDARYFNAGIMLMDLRAMRQAGFTDRVLEFARANHSRLVWGDQDALNGVVRGAYRPLHPRWNCMNALFYFSHARDVFDAASVEQAVSAPAILHFEGPDDVKPWHVSSTHPWRRRYLRDLTAALWLLPLPLSTRLARSLWYALPMPVRRALARLRKAARR